MTHVVVILIFLNETAVPTCPVWNEKALLIFCLEGLAGESGQQEEEEEEESPQTEVTTVPCLATEEVAVP